MKLYGLFLLILYAFGANAQQSIEKRTLTCLNTKLEQAHVDYHYLLEVSDSYNILIQGNNVERFEHQRAELDSLLRIAGFFKHGNLNFDLLLDCMEGAYKSMKVKPDSSSSMVQLMNHVRYLSMHNEAIKDLSPMLQIEAIRSTIKESDASKEFYRVMKLILFQGISFSPSDKP